MSVLSFLAWTCAAFATMEGVAYASHRWIMHGFGWAWHASHHELRRKHSPQAINPFRRSRFEKNDLYGIVFSVLAMVCIGLGLSTSGTWALLLPVGCGITLYGISYCLLHDFLSHGRFGMLWKPRNAYLRAVVRSHHLHHACRERVGAVSFGFLVPMPKARRERLTTRQLAKTNPQAGRGCLPCQSRPS